MVALRCAAQQIAPAKLAVPSSSLSFPLADRRKSKSFTTLGGGARNRGELVEFCDVSQPTTYLT